MNQFSKGYDLIVWFGAQRRVYHRPTHERALGLMLSGRVLRLLKAAGATYWELAVA